MKVAVTGASGLIGSATCAFLLNKGHEVVRPARSGGKWDIPPVDAVIHLAGESIAEGRWTEAKKARIRDSRIEGSRFISEVVRPPVLICASAIGYYGSRGDEILREESAPGTGFLADVVRDWEAAAKAPRVVHLRFGIVLSAEGGALAKMLTPFNLGVGGRVGSGAQFYSWVSIDDAVAAIYHALTSNLSGPVNVVSPNPVTNLEFTKTLGRVLRCPTVLPLPATAARLALGEVADALLLASARVEPARLKASGFAFQHPELEGALRHVLGPRPTRRRLIALALIGMLAITGALAYRHFWKTLDPGTGPAGPPVPRDAFQSTWTQRPVLLLGLGDSITDGFGARDGYGYFDRLRANPPDEFEDMRGVCLSAVLPNLTARNLSVSGSVSRSHLDQQIKPLEVQSPDVLGIVVITTGGNDIIHPYGHAPPQECAMYGATMTQARPWIDAFEKRLAVMIDEINRRFPGGCYIFLANIYDPTDGVGNIEAAGLPAWPDGLEILGAYNAILARAAHGNVHLVDIRTPFLGHGINGAKPWTPHYCSEDPHYWYYENIEDPNERGYDAIRRLFLLEIIPCLKS